jgi:hypothetical protein
MRIAGVGERAMKYSIAPPHDRNHIARDKKQTPTL